MLVRRCHLPLFLALAALCGESAAHPAIQFRADRAQTLTTAGNAVAEWRSADGSFALSPAHMNNAGWCLPPLSAGRVRFGVSITNAISPLSFPVTATGLVSRAFVVADCTNGAALATLLDAPAPLRMAPPHFHDAPWYLEMTNALGAASVSMDGIEGAPVPCDGSLHLLEVALDPPVLLSEIHLGGSPATPAWNRSWHGSVAEVVLLDGTVGDGGLSAVRAYLALKWSLPLGGKTPEGLRDTLRQLGVNPDPLFSSVVIAR